MAVSEPTREQHKRDLAVEVLRTSGQMRLAARGYSMLPSLWPGDILTIAAATLPQLSPGDLMLYRRDGSFFIHRVLRRKLEEAKLSLVARGDSMPGEDVPVSPEEVLGKVVSVERSGRLLAQVPACTPVVRAFGLALGSSGRLRSFALWLHQRRKVRAFEIASDGVVSL